MLQVFHHSLVAVLMVMMASETHSIVVTFGTRGGPILPPTPTPKVIPVPPYKSPAPVWEDQSDDIPNPKPFVYRLPAPSRTNSPLNDIFGQNTTPKYSSSDNIRQNNNYVHSNSYKLPTVSPRHTSYIASKPVQQFGVKYIPNYGLKYYPIVPMHYYNNIKNQELDSNYIHDDGKYNSKYEKKYAKYSQAKLAQANLLPLLSRKHLHYLNHLQQQPHHYSSKYVHQG